MRIRTSLMAAGLGLFALAGCADPYAQPVAGTSTTTVTRDAYGNPIAARTTVHDAYGNTVSSAPGAAPYNNAYPAPGYQAPPGYQTQGYGSSYQDPAAIARAQDPGCRATVLHQDRPGGNDYNPYRGAPSC
jgi:hypothetical protein